MDKELDLSHDSESVKVDKEIRCENVKIDKESDCEHVDQETDCKNVKMDMENDTSIIDKESDCEHVDQETDSKNVKMDMENDTSINDKVDKETDLPLMANIESVKMLNYLMELFCDFKKEIFSGSLILHLQFLDQTTASVILDCCDVNIIKVVLLQPPGGDQELDFEITEWALTVSLSREKTSTTASLSGDNLSSEIKIYYETKPESRSLHWRKDFDGNLCVYTPASAINNRGLFPCQDIPGAMSSWEASILLPLESNMNVYTTGDAHALVSETVNYRKYWFKSGMVLPMSTFAVAVGAWSTQDLSFHHTGLHIPIRLIGPEQLIRSSNPHLLSYIPVAVKSAVSILGPYPLPKLDVLIVSRCFSGLGLSSPNLIFISPSLLLGDISLLVKISHEICHAWFGIMLGAKDWTEAWLSEGFATFLEDFVHQRTLESLGVDSPPDLVKLRALMKLKTLEGELESTSADLTQLRPMRGVKLKDDSETGFVKNGLNPLASLTQAHYLKGFFLLHYLMSLVEETSFLNLIRRYFEMFKGELVDSTQFLQMYYQSFRNSIRVSLSNLINTWLDSHGLPEPLSKLVDCPLLPILNCKHITLYQVVMDLHKQILIFNTNSKLTGRTACTVSVRHTPDFSVLVFSEQLILFLDSLTSEKLKSSVLKYIYDQNEEMIRSNLDVLHLWCEIVVFNKFKPRYDDIEYLLVEHQSMGVYLYSELIFSKNKIQVQLFHTVFDKIEQELDPSIRTVIRSFIDQTNLVTSSSAI